MLVFFVSVMIVLCVMLLRYDDRLGVYSLLLFMRKKFLFEFFDM